jgi:gliding motility-associated-like protein
MPKSRLFGVKLIHLKSNFVLMKFIKTFLFSIWFLLMSNVLVAQAVNLDEGLVLNLRFNLNANDLSINNVSTDLLGAFFRKDRFGNCEYALGFDKYLQLLSIDKLPFDGLQDFSVSVWIKNENSGFGTFLSVANSDRDNEFNLSIDANGVILSNVRNLPNVKGIAIDGTISLNDGNWHHVLLTRNGTSGETRIFIDKQLDATKKMPLGIIQVGVGGFVLGNDQDCLAGCYKGNQQFAGALDDLRVYDRVLNSNEKDALFDYFDGQFNNEPLGSFSTVDVCDSNVELSVIRNFDSFAWNTGSTSETLQVESSGTYIVKGLVRDCEFSDTTVVIINTLPEMEITSNGVDLTCTGEINIEASGGFTSYTWSDGSRGRIYTDPVPGIYSVSGISDCGQAVSNTIEIFKSQELALEIRASSTSIRCGESVLLEASDGFDEYSWSTGQSGKSIEISKSGIYEVITTTVCGDELKSEILVSERIDSDFFIPNTFTPNRDGKNETFEIDIRLQGANMIVVNRWGSEVFRSDNYQNNWDGSSESDGSYYFIISSACLKSSIKGWVQIIR